MIPQSLGNTTKYEFCGYISCKFSCYNDIDRSVLDFLSLVEFTFFYYYISYYSCFLSEIEAL